MAVRCGRRIRKGIAGTAVAAAAMAALSASTPPGTGTAYEVESVTPPPGPPIDGGSPYITVLPPLNSPGGPGASVDLTGAAAGTDLAGGTGLPISVLTAYKRAESSITGSNPRCGLRWELLAAIGQVESNHARGGNVDSGGTTLSPIRGPQLNGVGFADIPDTDDGLYDGDTTHDRAVGPMQFIPSTWATWGADGNGDGEKDPDNIYDAALAAGHYLCAGSRDLSVPAEMDRAILGYNHSREYLRTVKTWYAHFRAGGAAEVPDSGGFPAATSAPSSSPAPSTSPSPSASAAPSASDSPTPGPAATATGSVGPSPTWTVSATPGPTWTKTPTKRPTTTPTVTPTTTPTVTPPGSGCPTITPTPSATSTPSSTPTPSATPAPTSTPTLTPSPTSTATGDPCVTPAPSVTPTPSVSGPAG